MKTVVILLSFLLCMQVMVFGQAKAVSKSVPEKAETTAMTKHVKGVFDGIRFIILRAAEKMPEKGYAYKPTDSVKSYGEILAHIASSQYYFGALATDLKRPEVKIDPKGTSKKAVIEALKNAFAYMEKAYKKMNPALAVQTVKFMGNDTIRIGVLDINNIHVISHYGNLVTYLRMKGMVPPTSEQMPPKKSK